MSFKRRGINDKLVTQGKGRLTEKQARYAEYVAIFPDIHSSRYSAFIEAGFAGNKKDCDKLFNDPKIQKAIRRYRKSKMIIAEKEFTGIGKKIGRTHLLTEDLMQKFEECMKHGMAYIITASFLNITDVSVHSWFRQGRKAQENEEYDSRYYYFLIRANRARAEGEKNLLDNILLAANGGHEALETEVVRENGLATKRTVKRKNLNPDWKASAWLLERTRKGKYGKDNLIDDTQTDPVTVNDEAKETVTLINRLIETEDNEYNKEKAN